MPLWDNRALFCSSLLSYSGGRTGDMLQGAQLRTLVQQYLWKTARNRKDMEMVSSVLKMPSVMEWWSTWQGCGHTLTFCVTAARSALAPCSGAGWFFLLCHHSVKIPIPHMSRQAFILQSRCLSKTKAFWMLSVFSGMVQHFAQWLYILAGSRLYLCLELSTKASKRNRFLNLKANPTWSDTGQSGK